ncbi:MAG: long-chain fatty acid--CoA ligase [Sphingomonadaceae bacterium]
MFGAMQDYELVVSHLIDHAAREHGPREIVTYWADGTETRTNWANIRRDALKMVQALQRLGIRKGDRVATLAMNHARHLVSWYGGAGAGAVVHTVNPRLFEDQLAYIVDHAEDRVLLYDAAFSPIVERMKDRWPTVEHYICYDSDAVDQDFESWIGAENGNASWADLKEREPCMLCYTSGTTGNPKGVIYEHRSTMLHAISGLQPGILDFDVRSVMLPVVPMFHAASWGIPWGAAAAGAKLVFSTVNDPAILCTLMQRERVTHSAGVPTVWLAMFQYMDETGATLPDLRQAIIGGSAAPRSMIERLMKSGVHVAHAWGMTETSPIGTTGAKTFDWDDLSFTQQVDIKQMQGRVPYGVELRTVDLDDPGKILPRDGISSGALHVRGPWIIKRYFRADKDCVDENQWFDTGDVAILHADGTLQLTDRSKDVIKSGGEWISSVDLENAAVGHPAIAEAAAIGIPHPKWDERPLLVVVRQPGADVSGEEIREYLLDKVAKWWIPDAVEFVDSIPHSATGKISKKDLREQFRDYALPADG